MLAFGNTEPHNREEAIRWLEQMVAHVDFVYAIGVILNRQWNDAMLWSSGKADEQGICYINVKLRKLPRMMIEFIVYHLGMLRELEEENLQDRILANLVEVENALVGPLKIQAIC